MGQFTSSTFGNMTKKWLVGVGVLELVLAGAFVVGSVMEPMAAAGLGLTALILGITGIVLVVIGLKVGASAADAQRIISSGLAGTAQITGLSQTGMTLNDQPQIAMDLMVQLPGRAPYAARRKEFVPLIMLGRVTSGLPLPVRVDPADPQKVVIDWANAGAAGIGSLGPFGALGGVGGFAGFGSADGFAGPGGEPGFSLPQAGAVPPAGFPAAPGMQTAAPGMPTVPPPPGPTGALPWVQSSQATPAEGGVGFAAIPSSGAAAPGAPPSGASLPAGQTETLSQVQAALAASGMPAAQPFASAEQGNYTVDQLRELLRVHGIPGQATIDRLADTGEVVGDERLFTMQVTLHVPGRPPQQLDPSAAMVPLAVASKVKLGLTVPVRVAPDNPGLVLFEWEKV